MAKDEKLENLALSKDECLTTIQVIGERRGLLIDSLCSFIKSISGIHHVYYRSFWDHYDCSISHLVEMAGLYERVKDILFNRCHGIMYAKQLCLGMFGCNRTLQANAFEYDLKNDASVKKRIFHAAFKLASGGENLNEIDYEKKIMDEKKCDAFACCYDFMNTFFKTLLGVFDKNLDELEYCKKEWETVNLKEASFKQIDYRDFSEQKKIILNKCLWVVGNNCFMLETPLVNKNGDFYVWEKMLPDDLYAKRVDLQRRKLLLLK